MLNELVDDFVEVFIKSMEDLHEEDPGMPRRKAIAIARREAVNEMNWRADNNPQNTHHYKLASIRGSDRIDEMLIAIAKKRIQQATVR